MLQEACGNRFPHLHDPDLSIDLRVESGGLNDVRLFCDALSTANRLRLIGSALGDCL